MKNFSIKHLFPVIGMILLMSYTNSFGQDRENKAMPLISKTVLWSLTNATGWVKSMDGQWLSGKNKILQIGLSSADMSLYNKGAAILGVDNFNLWTARDITIEGKSFLLITKVLMAGRYRYKYITDPDDIIIENKTVFMVIKKIAQNSIILKIG